MAKKSGPGLPYLYTTCNVGPNCKFWKKNPTQVHLIIISCSSNFCEYLMNLIVDINTFRFFVSSNLPSPYKSKLIRLLSLTIEREIEIFSKSFFRFARFELQKWQRRKKCIVVSASILQEQSGFNMSLKPCLNLCPRRWLKPNLSLVNIFIPSGSLILNIFLSTGLINFNNALRKI